MLTTKQIGIIMFGLSILLAVIVVSFYYSVSYIMTTTACGVDDCPAHRALPVQTAIGLTVVGILAVFSLVLFVQDEKIKTAHAEEKKKTEFESMLDVLKEDEKKIVEIVKAQQGIQQNTLRLKTDFSKAKLSMLLSDLEKRGIIKKDAFGKTNKVYLRR